MLRRAALVAWLAVAGGALARGAHADGLFDDDAVLDVTLRGPIAALVRKKASRDESPFVLVVDGREVPVDVRLRGHSRVKLCRFPPLRLDFASGAGEGTPFAGLDKVKLVTHCKDGERAEDSLRNEYLAYRIFNRLSEASYRVRLLRVTYEESEGRRAGHAETHPAFLIEPQERLAARLGGRPVVTTGVRFDQVDASQLARVGVFAYLAGNPDWSMAVAEGQDECCHNIDLVDAGGGWQAVPYDFDLSMLADARYSGPFAVRQAGARAYLGYCPIPAETVRAAVREARAAREDIMTLARTVPAGDESSRAKRIDFLDAFFEADEADLLAEFQRDCRGRR